MGIKIKTQTGAVQAPQALAYGELAVCKTGGLYVGDQNGSPVYCSNIVPGGGILQNPEFNINQRGKASYSTDSGSILIAADRWEIGRSTTFNAASKTITCTAYNVDLNNVVQNFLLSEKSVNIGDTLTFSAVINGKSIIATGTMLDRTKYSAFDSVPNAYEDADLKIKFHATASINRGAVAIIPKKALAFKWVKLEKGALATPFIPKTYTEELVECCRYFKYLKARVRYVPGTPETTCYPHMFDIPMRIAPTFTKISNIAGIEVGTDSLTPFGFSVYVSQPVSANGILEGYFSADV